MGILQIKINFPKSTGILLVVLCAVLGYGITSWFVLRNVIQYSVPRKSLLIEVPNGNRTKENVIFSLKVTSNLPIDSVSSVRPIDYVPIVKKNILFHQNPSFLIWTFLISTMISIAAGSVPFFISKIFELKKKFSLSRKKVWIGGFLYAGLLDLFIILTNNRTTGFYQPPHIIDDFHILFNDGSIISALVLTNLILILPGLVVMFLTGVSSDSIYIGAKNNINDINFSNKESIEDAVKKLKYLNMLLQNTLQIMAIIVVFSVLTTSALGDSIRSTLKVEGLDLFPKQIGYIYGMYFSLFLCIVYIPIYYYLKNNYNGLKELAADPINIPNSTEWYTSLFGDVKFEGSAIENLKLALTIIAPIITSFLPNTFDFFK
jgi:hypothetical protein